MSEELQITESPKLKKIRQGLEAWLSKGDWTFDELRRWLKGYELPAVGYEIEPYSWILRGFPKSEHYYEVMARRIAQFLQQAKPYENLSDDYDDALFYNLFHLCAGLERKNQLGRPLADIFAHFENDAKWRERFFSRDKQYNLNNAFREALITNQIDTTFKDVWTGGLEGKQTSFLLGDVYSHFRGVLYLNDHGQPLIDEIGSALKNLADYLDPEKTRHEKFRRLLARVKEVWPPAEFSGDWNEVLFSQAMDNDWPDWAVVELEDLAIPVGASTGGMQRHLIWEIYLPFLEELEVDFKVVSRRGVLLKIDAAREASLFLEKTSQTVEQIRLRSPFRSYKSILGVANQGFMDLELYFTSINETELAWAINEGRRLILNSLGCEYAAEVKKRPGEMSLYANLISLLDSFTPKPLIFIGPPEPMPA